MVVSATGQAGRYVQRHVQPEVKQGQGHVQIQHHKMVAKNVKVKQLKVRVAASVTVQVGAKIL